MSNNTDTTSGHAAQLRAAEQAGEVRNAIEDTLSVFEAEPGAIRALEYLGALLAANAEARAADEWRERALKAEAALAARGASGLMTGTGHSPAPAGFARTALDQAAAEMAAESARKSTDADRMAARIMEAEANETVAHLRMLPLSWEVSSLSNKMKLSADLTAQLLLLLELRAVRKLHEHDLTLRSKLT